MLQQQQQKGDSEVCKPAPNDGLKSEEQFQKELLFQSHLSGCVAMYICVDTLTLSAMGAIDVLD